MDDGMLPDFTNTAIHEAAHAAIACYLGYPILCIEVINERNGGTIIDYGHSQETVNIWMDYKAGDSRFLPPKNEAEELHFPILAGDLVMILTAGRVAECMYLNNTEELHLTGSDHLCAEYICNRFGIDLLQELRDMHELLRNPPFWQAVEHLSKRIMDSRSLTLDASGIKASFQESGFLDYCAELNKAFFG